LRYTGNERSAFLESIYILICNRARARQTKDDDEKERCLTLARNALNVCSVAACLAAFEDCKEGDGYDLGVSVALLRL
jgi:hypothetical protein